MKKAVKKSWPKPKKEKAEKAVEETAIPQTPAPVEQVIDEGPVCECGKPVAVGQTYVCADHIRRG